MKALYLSLTGCMKWDDAPPNNERRYEYPVFSKFNPLYAPTQEIKSHRVVFERVGEGHVDGDMFLVYREVARP